MDLAGFGAAASELLAVITGPAVGAGIALVGVRVSQRMQRTTHERAERREEVRNLAADLLALTESLWRRGWLLHQATWRVYKAYDDQGEDSDACNEGLRLQASAMEAESAVHEEVLAAQRRLMLTSPQLDAPAAELIDASRLWPPTHKRPDNDRYMRRDEAERAFVDAVREELGTTTAE